MSNRITHIRKPDGLNAVETLEAVKGIDSLGKEWEATVPQVIALISEGHQFYVEAGRHKFAVVVANKAGRECIRTRPDSTMLDNLLNLPGF